MGPQGSGARAALSYVPEASASVEGSVSFTFLVFQFPNVHNGVYMLLSTSLLQEVARVGASLSATIPYEICAEESAKFCLSPGTGSFEKDVCTDLF